MDKKHCRVVFPLIQATHIFMPTVMICFKHTLDFIETLLLPTTCFSVNSRTNNHYRAEVQPTAFMPLFLHLLISGQSFFRTPSAVLLFVFYCFYFCYFTYYLRFFPPYFVSVFLYVLLCSLFTYVVQFLLCRLLCRLS